MIPVLVALVDKIDPSFVASLLIALTGLLGAPIIEVIKRAVGIDGKMAVGLASGLSVVLAVVVTGVNGLFMGFDFSLPAIAQNTAVIFSMATLYYKLIMGQPSEDEPVNFDPTDVG